MLMLRMELSMTILLWAGLGRRKIIWIYDPVQISSYRLLMHMKGYGTEPYDIQ